MNRFLRQGLLLTLLLLLPGVTGCKKLFKKKTPIDAGVAIVDDTTTTVDPQDKEDEALGNKVGEYIRNCMNAMSSRVYQSRRRYLSWVPKNGPTGRETRIYGLYQITGASKCDAAATKAKGMLPSEPGIEAAGQRYAKAVLILEPIIKDAYTYYDQKNYRDDKFAKGKVLHAQLMAAFEEFVKADHDIHQAVGAVTKPLSQRQLARIEREEGKKFRFHRRNVLNIARDLVEIGDPSGEDDEVSFAIYDATFQDLDKALTGLKDYGVLRRSDLMNSKKAKIGATAAYDNFVRACEEYVRRARDYGRCLRDAPAFAKTKDGKVDLDKLPRCKDSGRRDFGDKYDAFIVTSNANSFPF